MTVLITGPTSGIGLQIARELAGQGAQIVLACRDVSKGEAVADELRRLGAPDARVRPFDAAGAPSIEALAAWISTLGVEFEILEPAGAARALAAMADRIRRAGRTAR